MARTKADARADSNAAKKRALSSGQVKTSDGAATTKTGASKRRRTQTDRLSYGDSDEANKENIGIRDLFDSMPRRLRAVIASEGRMTKY